MMILRKRTFKDVKTSLKYILTKKELRTKKINVFKIVNWEKSKK